MRVCSISLRVLASRGLGPADRYIRMSSGSFKVFKGSLEFSKAFSVLFKSLKSFLNPFFICMTGYCKFEAVAELRSHHRKMYCFLRQKRKVQDASRASVYRDILTGIHHFSE